MPKVLITSGGTREKIDPARFISNYSSGKMGAALAEAFAAVGFEVVMVSAPDKVESADEMLAEVLKNLPVDIFVSAAAVADKKPKKYSPAKIKKENLQTIELVDNVDILQAVATHKQRPRLVVGFAAESENHMKNAREKLTKKSCDLIVANDISALGSDENEVWLVGKNSEQKIPKASKQKIAAEIVKKIKEIYGEH